MKVDAAVVKQLAVKHQLTTPSMYEACDRQRLLAFAAELLTEHCKLQSSEAATDTQLCAEVKRG